MRVALAISGCLVSVLIAADSASAHIGVTPGLLVAGDTQTLILTVHNDLERPMTGLRLTAPRGTRIVAGAGDAWEAVIENDTATWTGGPLPANTGTTFELEVAVDGEVPVGPLRLEAEQLYPGGRSRPWPIPMTVVPARDESSQPLTWGILGGLAVLVTAGLAFAAQRRRGGTLQEK